MVSVSLEFVFTAPEWRATGHTFDHGCAPSVFRADLR